MLPWGTSRGLGCLRIGKIASQSGTRFIPSVNAILILEGRHVTSFLALLHSPTDGTGCAHGLTQGTHDGCWWIRGDLQGYLCPCGRGGLRAVLGVDGCTGSGAAPCVQGAQPPLGITVGEENGQQERGSCGAGVAEKKESSPLQAWPQPLAVSCKKPRFFQMLEELCLFFFLNAWTNVCS